MMILESLNTAVTYLQSAQFNLGGLLSSTSVSGLARQRLGALSSDILVQTGVLSDAHAEAMQVHTAQTSALSSMVAEKLEIIGDIPPSIDLEQLRARLTEVRPRLETTRLADSMRNQSFQEILGVTQPFSERLMIAYKALFYFVRAYHDGLYCTIRELHVGKRCGEYSSMNDAAARRGESGKLVHQLITDWSDEYFNWFGSWRERRNTIKVGRPLSISGPDEDLGVIFIEIQGQGIAVDLSGRKTVRISDAVEAISWSARVTEFVADLARNARVTGR